MKANFAIIIALFGMQFMVQCMEINDIKPKIEAYYKNYLEAYGTADAPQCVQDNLQVVQDYYKKKNLLHPKSEVFLKLMNENALNTLKQMNAVNWNNCFNNLICIIHIDPRHSTTFTKEESKFFLAHELAHIALAQNQYSIINPHQWANIAHFFAGLGLAAAIPTFGFALLESGARANFKPLKIYGISCAALYSLKKFLDSNQHEEPIGRTLILKYKCLEKTEEMICDIVAATTLPNGAKAGVSLYQKFLDNIGNTSGVSRSHPKTSTRITYLKFIDWFQERKK